MSEGRASWKCRGASLPNSSPRQWYRTGEPRISCHGEVPVSVRQPDQIQPRDPESAGVAQTCGPRDPRGVWSDDPAPAVAQELLNVARFVYRSEQCDRMHVFWDGIDEWLLRCMRARALPPSNDRGALRRPAWGRQGPKTSPAIPSPPELRLRTATESDLLHMRSSSQVRYTPRHHDQMVDSVCRVRHRASYKPALERGGSVQSDVAFFV